jgi:hypothetical protein
MKRYLVFAGAIYSPAGGVDDLIAAFEQLTDALQYARDHAAQAAGIPADMVSFYWWQILDVTEMKTLSSRRDDQWRDIEMFRSYLP